MPFKCRRCGECCRRYWITLLPQDVDEEAAFLGISVREFVDNYTTLYLRIFPIQQQYRKHGLVVSSAMLPKRIAWKAEHILFALPPFFLVLPILALKREGKACIFFGENKCLINDVKPEQCELFPAIAFADENFRALYPFCRGLKASQEGLENRGGRHYERVRAYFEEVAEKGFSALWPAIPKNGIAVMRGKKLCEISEREFNEAISATASP